jgi:hypothetical protein
MRAEGGWRSLLMARIVYWERLLRNYSAEAVNPKILAPVCSSRFPTYPRIGNQLPRNVYHTACGAQPPVLVSPAAIVSDVLEARGCLLLAWMRYV